MCIFLGDDKIESLSAQSGEKPSKKAVVCHRMHPFFQPAFLPNRQVRPTNRSREYHSSRDRNKIESHRSGQMNTTDCGAWQCQKNAGQGAQCNPRLQHILCHNRVKRQRQVTSSVASLGGQGELNHFALSTDAQGQTSALHGPPDSLLYRVQRLWWKFRLIGISGQVRTQQSLEQLAVIRNAKVKQFMNDHLLPLSRRLREQVRTRPDG